MTTTMRTKGTTDEISTCESCGRANLAKTVIMAELDADGNEIAVAFFGTTCAANAAGRPAKEIKTEALEADRAAAAAAAATKRAEALEADAEWGRFLTREAGAGERADQIHRLGGFAAARDLQELANRQIAGELAALAEFE